jgi:mannose-6-phosphate isomerase-like protein (cupin superfamily)
VKTDSPAPWASLVDALRADSPIAVLEASERQLKQILQRELALPLDGPRMRALALFQQDLGFLLKYKSYAVKAASPLGYSVFLQRPGEGFSFQQHVTHKTEIFYILEVLAGGFVFLCDFEDWKQVYDRDSFLDWMNGKPDNRYERFRFVPQPGDVIVIDRLSVVHSVVGCVLAEFATVSTDMVDRLHDQNEGRSIPAEFTRAFSEARIRALAWPDRSRQVTFGRSGWSRTDIPSRTVKGGEQTVFGNDARFSASVFRISPGSQTDPASVADRATSLHVANGSGQLLLGTAEELRRSSPPSLRAAAGDLFLIAPGAQYTLVNDGANPLVVARHEIPPDVAFV